MKWFLFTSCLLISTAALAGGITTPPPKTLQQQSNVEVVNGKRFFSLSGARRFNGSVGSPHAMTLVHAPRQKAVTRPHPAGLPLVPSGDAAAAQPKSESEKVLSIFAPEDKSVSPAAPLNSPIKE